MSTDSRRCHELVRPKESRCDAEVLCPMGEPEGAQLERHERDEETEGGQEEEEAQERMRRKSAGKPTEKEVRVHRVSHLPFRDWCRECVAGRA